MRLILQRVSEASVTVEGEVVGKIGPGLLVLVGIERGDDLGRVRTAAEKLAGLRIFEDADGKMNLDAAAVGGAFGEHMDVELVNDGPVTLLLEVP